MKTFIILCSLVISTNIFAQTAARFSFQKIGWTIDLPPGFVVSDSGESKTLLHEGLDIVQNTTEAVVDPPKTIILIIANKDENLFSAIVTPFNSEVDNWDMEHENMKTMLCQSMKSLVPDALIDTLSSNTIIDGIQFDSFKMNLTLNGKIVASVMALSKLYKGFDFGITYSCYDKVITKEIEEMLAKSSFSKK